MNSAGPHFSAEQVKRYLSKSLDPEELLALSDHAATCRDCRSLLANADAANPARRTSLLRADGEAPFHLTYELMSGQVKGELTAVDRELVESHLADCQMCRRELEDLSQFKQALVGEAEATLRPTRVRRRAKPSLAECLSEWWENWTARWLLMAGAGAMAALVVLLTLQYTGRSPSPGAIAASDAPSSSSGPRELVKDGGQTLAMTDGHLSGLPPQWPEGLRQEIETLMAGGSLPSTGLPHLDQQSARGIALSQSRISGRIAPPSALSNPPSADYTLERVKEVCPDSHLALGLALWKSGDLAGAKREFEALAAANPGSAIAARLQSEAKAAMPMTLQSPLHSTPR